MGVRMLGSDPAAPRPPLQPSHPCEWNWLCQASGWDYLKSRWEDAAEMPPDGCQSVSLISISWPVTDERVSMCPYTLCHQWDPEGESTRMAAGSKGGVRGPEMAGGEEVSFLRKTANSLVFLSVSSSDLEQCMWCWRCGCPCAFGLWWHHEIKNPVPDPAFHFLSGRETSSCCWAHSTGFLLLAAACSLSDPINKRTRYT